ncbi:ArsR/SmtB family transcription factor [Yinghuangia soli]|uniref:Metalloregulator ArsR/SmtB family transcription factor n=1 Tax=Yinghuangia soli TaxID=2908204 RepID=A0AA41PWF0_9ACTN|nr:metalloregulator ArsR/SmtB family transcription factor [Yinghuangia soli]MCF2526976.1 metalloregulator ArsR/SmtB family transcription factor [Yinghuangia soli]
MNADAARAQSQPEVGPNGPAKTLDADTAATYASWFKALADPTRVRLVNLLAVERRPMSVGEIVERSEVGQSTVSHHLKLLAEVRFVLAEKRGTSTYYRVNENCLSCFPSAADAVMGHPAPDPAAVPCEES